MEWLNILVQGALLGGLYALFAVGLSLSFGIMRLVNIAHGDLIVLAAYIGLVTVDATGWHALTSLAVVLPAMFALGYLLQRGLLNFTLGSGLLPPLLVTFGLSVIIENLLLVGFGPDIERLHQGAIDTASLTAGGIAVGVFPVLVFATAVTTLVGLQFLFYRTGLGRAFRAASDDAATAALMGIDNRHLYGLATAIAMIFTGLAGILMAVRTDFDPAAGPNLLIFAFEAVIIGGLGSLWGTLLGGMVLGIAQAVGAAISPNLEILAGHITFLAILVLRPSGLFPRTIE